MKRLIATCICCILAIAPQTYAGIAGSFFTGKSKAITEVVEFLSPYIGVNLEEIAEKTHGTIPDRYARTAYTEAGEYTSGKIGDYYGPISIVWLKNEYAIPQLFGTKIGMKRSEVEEIYASIINLDDALIQTDNRIVLFIQGKYEETKIAVTIDLLFCNSSLYRVELTVSSDGA